MNLCEDPVRCFENGYWKPLFYKIQFNGRAYSCRTKMNDNFVLLGNIFSCIAQEKFV